MTADPRTWLITGASAGLGRVLTETLLDRGHRERDIQPMCFAAKYPIFPPVFHHAVTA
ncbi:hypothetical protein [Streptomyces sp. NPDC059258]|uniref:hypothetical protein n=1 Tax=unclassified Streptomyces TaxID=2593676 RepID=UPI00368E395F